MIVMLLCCILLFVQRIKSAHIALCQEEYGSCIGSTSLLCKPIPLSPVFLNYDQKSTIIELFDVDENSYHQPLVFAHHKSIGLVNYKSTLYADPLGPDSKVQDLPKVCQKEIKKKQWMSQLEDESKIESWDGLGDPLFPAARDLQIVNLSPDDVYVRSGENCLTYKYDSYKFEVCTMDSTQIFRLVEELAVIEKLVLKKIDPYDETTKFSSLAQEASSEANYDASKEDYQFPSPQIQQTQNIVSPYPSPTIINFVLPPENKEHYDFYQIFNGKNMNPITDLANLPVKTLNPVNKLLCSVYPYSLLKICNEDVLNRDVYTNSNMILKDYGYNMDKQWRYFMRKELGLDDKSVYDSSVSSNATIGHGFNKYLRDTFSVKRLITDSKEQEIQKANAQPYGRNNSTILNNPSSWIGDRGTNPVSPSYRSPGPYNPYNTGNNQWLSNYRKVDKILGRSAEGLPNKDAADSWPNHMNKISAIGSSGIGPQTNRAIIDDSLAGKNSAIPRDQRDPLTNAVVPASPKSLYPSIPVWHKSSLARPAGNSPMWPNSSIGRVYGKQQQFPAANTILPPAKTQSSAMWPGNSASKTAPNSPPSNSSLWSKSSISPVSGRFLPSSGTNSVSTNPAIWPSANPASRVTNPTSMWMKTNPLHPANPLNPANSLNQMNPMNPANSLNQMNPANSLNQMNPANSLNQMNPMNPMNPANSLNQMNPMNPANSLSPMNPLNPANFLNSANPLSPNNPLNPDNPNNILAPMFSQFNSSSTWPSGIPVPMFPPANSNMSSSAWLPNSNSTNNSSGRSNSSNNSNGQNNISNNSNGQNNISNNNSNNSKNSTNTSNNSSNSSNSNNNSNNNSSNSNNNSSNSSNSNNSNNNSKNSTNTSNNNSNNSKNSSDNMSKNNNNNTDSAGSNTQNSRNS